jgi:hypothetical protein
MPSKKKAKLKPIKEESEHKVIKGPIVVTFSL